jgi:hypothetical protein
MNETGTKSARPTWFTLAQLNAVARPEWLGPWTASQDYGVILEHRYTPARPVTFALTINEHGQVCIRGLHCELLLVLELRTYLVSVEEALAAQQKGVYAQ